MSFKHAVVWIDHREAHVIEFSAEDSRIAIIKTHLNQQHLHHHRGTLGSGRVATDPSYLHSVVESFFGVAEVLVVGPGSAKLELIKHVHGHDPQVAQTIVGIETVDHPTDPQLLAYAKRYFLKVDNMRGDNFQEK
jgi:stalled ribosome rescue protein Dom34